MDNGDDGNSRGVATGRADAGQADAGQADAGQADAGPADAGPAGAGQADAGRDAGVSVDEGGEPAGRAEIAATDAVAGGTCAVVLNAGAGSLLGDGDAGEALATLFAGHGLHPRLKVCADAGEIDAFIRGAIDDGITTIVAGGGDGTVSAVAAALVETDATLGVLPLGTLNHFAKDLGIPLDREAAVETIARGRITRVDVGEVNGTIFLNNASLGLYPLAVRLREQEQDRGTGKWLALAKATIDVLGRYPLMRVHLTIDGREIVRRTPIVFIGNNHYELEGIAMTRRDRLDEGVLSICVTRDVGRLGLFGLLARAIVGLLRDARDFTVIEGSELWVETRHRSLRVATDGETQMMQTPLRFRSRPGSLAVIVPQDNPGTEGAAT